MTTGHISRLLLSQGCGFIVEDGRDEEVEFHWSAVTAGNIDQLHVGQRVEYEKRPDHRDDTKLRAVNIRLRSD